MAAQTSGNYGSTVWDSFNGDFLEFNICDPCLVRAGEQGRVNVGRTRRPVRVHGFGRAGWEPVEYAPVAWHAGLDTSYGEHEQCDLEPEELTTLKLDKIEFTTPREEILAHVEKYPDWEF